MKSTSNTLIIKLNALEKEGKLRARPGRQRMEFHVAREVRDDMQIDEALFTSTGNVIIQNIYAIRLLAKRMNEINDAANNPEKTIRAGQLNAMGLIDEILHYVAELYREEARADVFQVVLDRLIAAEGVDNIDTMLLLFTDRFPCVDVYKNKLSPEQWLNASTEGISNRLLALEELLMLKLANDNPAFLPFNTLFNDTAVRENTVYLKTMELMELVFEEQPKFGPDSQNLVAMLRSPMLAAPTSLTGQLEYMRSRWGLILGKFMNRLLKSLDIIKEEEKPWWDGTIGPSSVISFEGTDHEYERFSMDKEWMPRVVMLAKSTLVWLAQLSRKYARDIHRLDHIPDEELDDLASCGFNCLWLIGLWERSGASARIKNICGNPDAAPSAYSLFNYEIAWELGGWDALGNLRERCGRRGIRLAADMVPNHTGIDSDWMRYHPDYFLQVDHPPFPGYTFNGENLCYENGIGVYLEDHYYNKSDAAVVFKRVDFNNGHTRYIYHGNDGTSMPWNDTAQIDFLNPEAREAVIQQIMHVARNFSVIRFDAAMVLAKKHIRRLWYPEPGQGGDIASRAEHSIPRSEFDSRIPNEFWREVVDRCHEDVPDTLLLAEAFWMLEGYFVRTLGMHRVYNSAFMNMLKREENSKYRSTIKNTQEFDKDILKRYVNFMNNPDEDTAVAQFGKGDKYFGVCTMMITMPGLPMFGHGQIQGFSEKYGMEYRRDYWNETPDHDLIERHKREIFPLMHKRYIFSGVEKFFLYDFFDNGGWVNENVFAYSNQYGDDKALVVYNNAYDRAHGWINISAAYVEKMPDGQKPLLQKSFARAMDLTHSDRHFMLFHEQRSNLWFIRTSRDLCERGMQLILNGYQCQVFLDIHEVADDELGRYRALHDTLNGGGVHNIQHTMQDIFLKELYESFYGLYNTEMLLNAKKAVMSLFEKKSAPMKAVKAAKTVKKTKAASAKGKGKTTAAATGKDETVKIVSEKEITPEHFIESLHKPFKHFYETAHKFTKGTSHWPACENINEKSVAFDECWSEFRVDMLMVFNFFEATGKGKAALPQTAFMHGDLSAREYSLEFFLSYFILLQLKHLAGKKATGQDALQYVNHWHMDRKMHEALQFRGVPGDKSWNYVELIKAFLMKHDKVAVMIEEKGLNLHDLFALYSSDEIFVNAIGVNNFNGVMWFNKERFEDYVCYLSALLYIIPSWYSKEDISKKGTVEKESIKTRLTELAKMHKEFKDAVKWSNFKYEELYMLLTPIKKLKTRRFKK